MNLSLLSISKKYLLTLLLLLIGAGIESPVKAQSEEFRFPPEMVQTSEAVNNEALSKKASQAITLLASGNYQELRDNLSPELAEILTAENIQYIWARLMEKTGPVQKELDSYVVNTINANLVMVKTQFEKTTGTFIVTFNEEQEIVGIDFPKLETIEEISQIFVTALGANDYPKARGYLHPFLKTEIFPQQIQSRWEEMLRQQGQFKTIVDTQMRSGSSVDDVDVVIVTAEFENGTEDLFIIFDEERRIVGVNTPRIN